jgi:protein-S-isoprenylcysteine O-methyltransferase Ste14
MSLIELPLPIGELVIRVILLLGLVLHKVVWEVMKVGEKTPERAKLTSPRTPKSLFKSLIKLGKIFVLGFLVVQTIALNVLPISDQPTGLRLAGLGIYLLGLTLAITARVQLGKNWANIEDYQVIRGQSLVKSGVYQYIRHPIYTGDILLLLGLELALNSWLALGVIPLALIVYQQAKTEENMLSKKLPDYREYRKRTKMFIPFLIGLCGLIILAASNQAGPVKAQASSETTPNHASDNPSSFLPLVINNSELSSSRKLGQVVVLSTPTDCGGDSCYNLRVTCPNILQTRDAILRVGEPPTGTPFAGTILFATGWTGEYYWGFDAARPIEAFSPGPNPEVIASNNSDIIIALKAAGYRTVELKWATNWFQAASGVPEGMARLACRPASIVRWVYDNLHQGDTSKPYCATGHSNGAAQVSYALAQYGLSNILSAVVNESGPNWTREDDHCIQNPSFPKLYGTPGDRATDDWAFGYPNNGFGPCGTNDSAFKDSYKQQFIAASLQYGHWQYNYPHTFVAFLFGGLDTTATKAQGQAFYDFLAVNTPLLSAQIIPTSYHDVTGTPEGMQAMEDTLKSACVLH